ncbi:hypothetical protein GCM10028820_20380 [Tessaracoccus terricola]
MPKTWRRVAAVAAACALMTPLGFAAADTDLGDSRDHVTPPDLTTRFATTGKWFVELESEPTTSGGSERTIRAEQDKFLKEVERKTIPITVNSKYEDLFNGLAVESDAEGAAALQNLPGVVAVYPVFPVDRPEPQDISQDLYSAGDMTGATTVRSELGFTGEGVKVGIIDSGIDFDHPDLGGTGTDGGAFPTERVAYGWDFVGDDYNANPTSPTYQPVPKPDAIPDDCGGHGTHVAGIVGANGELTGIAPNVTFGAYRVFGCDGSTDTQIILDALERALADGMDVVNMSLGAAFQTWPEYPTGVASNRLVDAGVVVVASAGNEGDYFTQVTGSPSVGEKVIGVASYDNTQVTLAEILVTDAEGESESIGYLPSTGSPALDDSVNGQELAWTSHPEACEADTADLTGKIAVTSRGTCTFHEKAVVAQNAGASALIIANNDAGYINATVEGETEITIPVVTVTQAEGALLQAALTDDDGVVPTAAVTGDNTLHPNPTGGLVSDFSSWGLAADLTLKPDLGAPGGSIYSTYPLESGGFKTESGTSMAAPHVAGAIALMLEADPDLQPAQVLTALQNTATPTMFSYAPDLGILDAAHHQGAGLIQVDRAIQAATSVSPGKISTGESADGPFTQTLTISNDTDAEVTYDLSHVDAVSTYMDPTDPEATQNAVGFALFESQVSFSAPSVTVPAGGTAQVDVTIDADPEAVAIEGTQYSGYVVLQGAEGSDPLTVPFAGMAGDYGNLEIFPDLEMGLPAIVVLEGCTIWSEQQCIDPEVLFEYAPEDHVFGEADRDLPTIALHMAVPVLKVEVQVLEVDASGNPVEDSVLPAYSADLLGRDAGLSLWTWDGRVQGADGLVVEVEPGDYALRIVAHEADGDGGTQEWTSPGFGYKNTQPEPSEEPSEEPTPEPTPEPTKPNPQVDLYSTPGYHDVNGRKWFTVCEPYSQTVRCRTSIMATTVVQEQGQYVAKNAWVFNNLTYLPSAKSLWGANPLGVVGEWTAEDGRNWRTECNTPTTGGNGCRSYVQSKVIEVNPAGGFRWTTKWVFNNIVRFS